MRYAAFILALLGVLAEGCGGRQEPETPEQLGPEDFGALPHLKAVPDAKLRDELARITEEGGTPELLGGTLVAEEDNVAAGLVGLFPEPKIASILKESEKIFPPGKFEFDPIRLQKAINFRKKYDAQHLQVRDALGRPQCDFGIQFMAGCLAELKFIDVVRICARLEAFQAAESLSDDNPAKAIEALGFMLRLASCLGPEKHLVARLEAAFIRTEAFRVLQTTVQNDQVTWKHLERLCEMIEGQLAAWPNDADAWIGERASGLHYYEMVRDGQLISLLTPEEIERFAKEGSLEDFCAAAVRGINRDQLYYLETMRKIIDSCTEPYYLRTELLDTIGNDLQEKRNSPEFPIVAARLLLPDTRKAHAIQARDRANWEAWALALALATRPKMPSYQTNPLTGKKYQQAKYDGKIEVWNFASGKGGDHPLIIVPDLGGGE